jgi:hypothetical protein
MAMRLRGRAAQAPRMAKLYWLIVVQSARARDRRCCLAAEPGSRNCASCLRISARSPDCCRAARRRSPEETVDSLATSMPR